ncbi:hypothetical protein [Aquabacterium humicola]|uniref:hypothetical protein n=1 Tax=Aquabacterium humicola TaxID=3237377 RepID=UPI002543C85A|nr:hypothetical protein [Rubrivivax pictus]
MRRLRHAGFLMQGEMTRTRFPRAKVIFLPVGAEPFLPRAPAQGTVLGVVQRGMLTGALVKLDDGTYVQVNGDFVEPLNASSVEHAIRVANRLNRVHAPASHPTIVVKRRRVIDPSLRR